MPQRPQRNSTTTTFVPCVEGWIKSSHDIWMSVTYSPFFSAIETGRLKEVQWRYYCRDMAEIFLVASKLSTSLTKYLMEESKWYTSQYYQSQYTDLEPSSFATQICALLKSDSAVLALILSLSQGWRFISSERWSISEENDELISNFRQKINRDLEANKTQFERDNGKNAFDAVLKVLPACLDYVLEMGNDNVAVPCQCGRPGHIQEQCTFKSHLAPK